MAYSGHLGYFIPHLMNKKADLGFKVLKKEPKKPKNWKMPKNSHFFGVVEYLNLFCLNFAVAVKLYFDHFLQIKIVGKLKRRETA